MASLVEARELDDPVWAALAAVRPLGELSVLLGWGPGLEALPLFVISVGVGAISDSVISTKQVDDKNSDDT